MLVLSRRVGEEIVIAGLVRVRVAAIQGKRVRLAIAAPASVPVHREEIYRERIEFEQSAGPSIVQAVPEPV